MFYKKLASGNTIVEFTNDWLGVETVIVNGQEVSKKTSVWGTHHRFFIIENGQQARYVLTTKVNASMQILIDLSRNGLMIHEDVILELGGKPKRPQNKYKKKGLQKLNDYHLQEALEDFKIALDISPKDPQIHFHMACAYSVLEQTEEGFSALKKAVELGLQNIDMILQHDMLAFIRIHDAFEAFHQSSFTTYQLEVEV